MSIISSPRLQIVGLNSRIHRGIMNKQASNTVFCVAILLCRTLVFAAGFPVLDSNTAQDVRSKKTANSVTPQDTCFSPMQTVCLTIVAAIPTATAFCLPVAALFCAYQEYFFGFTDYDVLARRIKREVQGIINQLEKQSRSRHPSRRSGQV